VALVSKSEGYFALKVTCKSWSSSYWGRCPPALTRLLWFHFKKGVSLPPLTGGYFSTKQPAQILRLDEPREHFVTTRTRNPEN